jgi:hypothetical protein
MIHMKDRPEMLHVPKYVGRNPIQRFSCPRSGTRECARYRPEGSRLLFVYICGTDRGAWLLDPEGIRGSRCSPRYPGYQCPYCVRQIHDFVENADKFASSGTQVLLVYPGPPAELDRRAKEFLSKENSLPANVILVTDPDYKFTNQYGLRWDAPNETAYAVRYEEFSL